MATISITGSRVKGYAGSTELSGAVVGTSYDGSDTRICTARYAFTTDDSGAAAIRFRTSRAVCDVASADASYDSIAAIRFAVTASADRYRGYQGGAGYGYPAQLSYVQGSYVQGSLDVHLLPNTSYYLWLFPGSGFHSYTRFSLGSCTLTTSGTYAAASTVSAADGVFGEALPITLSRSANGVTHTVTVRCAGRTELLAEKSADYPAFSWTPALSVYAPLLPDAAEATAEITAETFYGAQSWGSRSTTVTLRFRDTDLLPVLQEGWCTLSADNTGGAAAGLSGLIQGFSRLRAAFDPTKIACQQGASPASFSLELQGERLSGAGPLVSAMLAESGSLTALCRVTDSRGQSAEESFSLSVLPYARPVLSQVRLFRSDDQGAASEDGIYLAAGAQVQLSPLDGQNSAALTAAFKLASAASYSAETPLQSGVTALIPGLDPDRSYHARLTVTDALGGSAEALVTIHDRRWAMKFNADGTAVGFGKAPTAAKTLEIPADWSIRRGGAEALFSDAPVPVAGGGTGAATAAGARQALGCVAPGDLFTEQLSQSVACAVGDTATGSFSAARSGARALGIVGHRVTGTQASTLLFYRLRLDGDTVYWSCRNLGSSAASPSLMVDVLYLQMA